MAETLRQIQSRFALAVAELLKHADAMGFAVTLGETKRSDEQAEINAMGVAGRETLAQRLEQNGYAVLAGKIRNNTGSGIRGSLHELGLAIDLNLFDKVTGEFLSTTEAHRGLGEWWESSFPGACWGGRFNDGNHYSFGWNGKK